MNTTELIDTTTRNILQFPGDTRVAVSTHTGMRAFAQTDAGPWYQRAWYVANDETGDHWRVELPV